MTNVYSQEWFHFLVRDGALLDSVLIQQTSVNKNKKIYLMVSIVMSLSDMAGLLVSDVGSPFRGQ